jgi:hypothetical protein
MTSKILASPKSSTLTFPASLHHQEIHAVLLADLVDAGDVGVREGGEHLGLPSEARQPLRIVGERRRQYLDRHLAPEAGVLGAVDLAHAALTELGGDAEVGEMGADQAPASRSTIIRGNVRHGSAPGCC